MHMKVLYPNLLVFAVCALGFAFANREIGAEPPPGTLTFRHFITRQGDKLMDGDREFRFVGANMPGLVLPYDYWLGIPERMVLPTPWEQADGLKSLRQMGARCTRTWNLPIRHPDARREGWHYVWGPGEFNEAAFETLDHLLAEANRYGVRVMLDLTADAGDYLGGVGTYAAHRGKSREAFFSDPQIKDDFKVLIRHNSWLNRGLEHRLRSFLATRCQSLIGCTARSKSLAWTFRAKRPACR